jgi:uracil-DNA glycosylase
MSNIPKKLEEFLDQEYAAEEVFPKRKDIFRALELCSIEDVKVVILGQDPYKSRQANGLAFAAYNNTKLPPSLRNVFKELVSDLDIPFPTSSSLEGWARQGVLLLNTILTTSKKTSHRNKGWEEYIDIILKKINEKQTSVVFIFWGNAAKQKKNLIDTSRHYVLESAHPSPIAPIATNNFFGCKHFSKTNQILSDLGMAPIDWSKID